MPGHDDKRALAEWIDDVADAFEAAWRGVQPPRPDDFLGGETGVRREQLRAELEQIDRAYRARVGQPPGATPEPDTDDTHRILRPHEAAPIPAVPDQPTIPGYDILNELGRGGMGVVHQARQVGLKRVVALKVIRTGAQADAKELARFRTEAEAAARLQHPNIVQIYEVGEWRAAGVSSPIPYLSMEFVDGGSLDKQLIGTPWPARQAAKLIETLARAVQTAHQQGIVHRDLKPANVLLTVDGIPKIADFGLAKWLESSAGPTQGGDILGTRYMAPEQASGHVKKVGPLVDVYALGVMLYELLTSRPPFQGESVLNILEQVRSHEPVLPKRLQPRLPRDLETICLKALAKSPGRRYASAEALANDLRQRLEGKPIQARPVSRAEKLWRWCRRNPLVAGLGAVLVTVLLVAAVGSTVAALRIAAARDEVANRARAEAEAKKKAEQNFQHAFDAVEEYFVKVSQRPELREHGFEELRRDLLLTAQQFYEQFIRERGEDVSLQEPLMVARFRLAILIQETDSPTAAIPYYQRALALAESLTRANPTTADYQSYAAQLHSYLGSAYRATGRIQKAEEAYLKGRAIHEQLVQAYPTVSSYRERFAINLVMLSSLYRDKSQLSEAEAALLRARDLYAQLVQEQPDEGRYQQGLALAFNNLGTVYRLLFGKYITLAPLRQALAIQERLVQEHPRVAEYQRDLASSHYNLAFLWHYPPNPCPDRAEAEYRPCVTILEKLVREHPLVPSYRHQLGRSYGGLALFYCETNRRDQSEASFHKASDIQDNLLRTYPTMPEYAYDCAVTCARLGGLVFDSDRMETALDWYKRAIDNLEAVLRLNAQHSRARQFLPELRWDQARCFAASGQYPEAIRYWKLASQAPGTTESLYHVAGVYAIAAAAAGRDNDLTPADRDQLVEECAGQAVGVLTKLQEAGFFKDPAKAADLKQDPDLSSLRERDDFKKLLAALEEKAKTGPQK